MIAQARPWLCLVTDRRQLSPDARTAADEIAALDRWLDAAFGRIDIVQIREPDLDAASLCDLVARVAGRAKGSGTAVVVNDRADVARAAIADGVHVRGDGPPAARVRAIAPPAGWVIGRSVHDVDGVRAETAADYLIFGTVFRSTSKPAEASVQGVGRLAEAVQASSTPVLAIGGIDPERTAQCRQAGAAGVAAIGVFLPPGRAPKSMGLEAAADALRAAMGESR